MGATCSFPRIMFNDIQVPQLKERNFYGLTKEAVDDKVLMSCFPTSHERNRKSNLIAIIQNNPEQLFQDSKFKPGQKQSLRLSVLFNFRTNKIRIYTKNLQTQLTSFIQLNIEFSYLTSIFYLLCRNQAKAKLLPRLIENQQTNVYGVYSTELFCNGQKHQVIIDDRMPTHNDSFLYLRIVKGIQLWPLILEKSWCKQIGSYEKAKGLSPQDAFEEITGIPAYTYTIKANNRAIIKGVINSAIGKGYWVVLIARNGLTDLTNRQVFYLETIKDDQYTIISPFVSYNFENSHQVRRGEVTVKQQDIFSHFQHIVVGFYKENYIPLSLPVTSNARQEVIFQINVLNREEVSIRFNQLYHGYLAVNDRPNYEYSPVMMELYQIIEINGVRKNFKLVNYCQGCNRSLSGSRSAQCSVNIMQHLQGKYLLRLEVGWNYQGLLNTGNLVVYASQGNVQISQLPNPQVLFQEIYASIFQNQRTNHLILHEHSLEVITFDKQKSTLIMFHNVTNSVHHFQADFSKSKNIRLRGRQVRNQYAYIRLQPDQKEIIEVVPQNMKQPMEIQNFQLNKTPLKR